MTIKTLAAKGVAKREIARQLSISEGTVRYHPRRLACGMVIDGHARQSRRPAEVHEAIGYWLGEHGHLPVNLAALRSCLMGEHSYAAHSFHSEM